MPAELTEAAPGLVSLLSTCSLEFLNNGWRVRGTMRSQAKVDAWEAKYPQHKPQLEWALVESLATPGAFDAAVKGVDAVAHVASPFTRSFDAPRENVEKMLGPAVKGTTSVLEAASRERSVKAVVITSSLAAAQDPAKGADVGFTRTAATWSQFKWDDMVKEEVPIVVYLGSKQFAEEAAWKFMQDEKPAFRLTTIVPPMILGPALQPLASLAELNLSSGAVWNIVNAPEIPPTHVPASHLSSPTSDSLGVCKLMHRVLAGIHQRPRLRQGPLRGCGARRRGRAALPPHRRRQRRDRDRKVLTRGLS